MTAVRAGSREPAVDTGAGFTLDADLLARRRAASARRVHAAQIRQVRAAGFAILMDCHMPGTDGFEATRRSRDDGRARGTHPPTVALTADALFRDRERCLASGMDDYMTKPVRTAQLAAAVQRSIAA